MSKPQQIAPPIVDCDYASLFVARNLAGPANAVAVYCAVRCCPAAALFGVMPGVSDTDRV